MARTLRITTGLILFLFVTMHLLNLCMAVFSVELADSTRPAIMFIWSNPVGGMLLMASMMVHMVSGLIALYHRNTLRMTSQDAVQFITALLIPPLLIPHAWTIIAAKQMIGYEPTFIALFKYFWIDAPGQGLRQVLLVVAIWIHGCIGLFTWFQLKPWWSRVANFVYPLAVAVPVTALLGFVEGGNFALEAIVNPTDGPAVTDPTFTSGLSNEEIGAAIQFINATAVNIMVGYLGVVALLLLARYWRLRKNKERVEVHYADGNVVQSKVGLTLLEIANMNDVPHANLCRGRGRCGTCRVLVHKSDSQLLPPSAIEQGTLERLKSPPNTRLACQIGPGPGAIHIERLLPADITATSLHRKPPDDPSPEPEPLAEEPA